ncbi:hypothetical protein Tco_1547279, partial [Tanacetum coccineum]
SLSNFRSKVFHSWEWTSNASLCSKGCRIIVGWNVDVVHLMVLSQSSKALHVKVFHKATNKTMFCSFIYVGNLQTERRLLWADLGIHRNVVCGFSWILMGDFNMALNMEDIYAGSSYFNSAMCEFKDCVTRIEVMDINSSGLHYTWNQKPKGGCGILKKLDRIMGNVEFMDAFPGAFVIFQPYRISDHSPAALDLNPTDSYLREEESVYLKAFNEAKLDEERFLKQKAKIDWLEAGDSNSSYFHKSIKCRNQRSRIEVVVNSDNIEVSGSHVPEVFVSHYEQFLGTSMECNELNVEGLFSKSISATTSSNMVCDITNDEIKAAMFDIGDDKAPGPDGYTSAFFKKGWSVVGHDVCNAVRDFFSNGCILKELHIHTCFLSLSKILSNRIIEGIKEVVSDNQAAFVPGRQISDNILITQELMHSYHRNRGPPRCAFKVDIQKAYDTVDWRFLETNLVRFGFHCTMVLVPSIPKSTAYFCNVVHQVKLAILKIMPFSERELPVKYLGVPLISSRLLNKDCKILVEKVKNRIGIGVNGEFKGGKAKGLTWETICLPKEEGGLDVFNIALMTTYIWNIVSNKGVLMGRYELRDISREGFSISTSVAELVTNGSWSWPQSWLLKASDLGLIPDPAWETLRPRGTQVPWIRIVWFSHAIPRHAFHLWLVMRNGLKTQLRMRQWDVGVGIDLNLLCYALCDSLPDSHAHLFFECPFSSKVWLYVRELAGMGLIPPIMHDIISYLQPISKKRTALSILGKLILAASSYFIWLERNNRVFKQVKKSPEDIRDIIMVTVRLKLLTFRFKDTSMVNQLLARWKIPKSFRLYG